MSSSLSKNRFVLKFRNYFIISSDTAKNSVVESIHQINIFEPSIVIHDNSDNFDNLYQHSFKQSQIELDEFLPANHTRKSLKNSNIQEENTFTNRH